MLDALRRRPHPTHFTLDEAVAMARRIGARRTYFTHIAHDLGHAATCAALPAGMALALRWADARGPRLMHDAGPFISRTRRRPTGPRPIAALGNFDGLHRGHHAAARAVRRQAGERGGTPVAMIFDPHPPRVLRPDKAPPLLMTLEQKLEAFERAGLQGVAIVRFTPRAVALGAGAVRRDAC